MKLAVHADDVQTNVNRSTKFTANVAILSQMLATSLYSDPMMASFREPLCNALDAQKRAGQGKVKITVPTEMNPTVSIQDTGTGMTDEFVIAQFSSLGGSDKRTNNIETGGFGVGKVAPLAFTDSFSLVSIVDGTKTFYTIMKEPSYDETGDLVGSLPAVQTMQTVSTNEPNGVTISFSIAPEMVFAFVQKMIQVLTWVDTELYEFVGSSLTVLELEFIRKGTGWALGRTNYNRVIMGNVSYRLDNTKITGLNPAEEALLYTGNLMLFMNNGECMPAMSREELQYTPKTVENIKQAIKTAADEIIFDWQTKIDVCTTRWEATCVYSSIYDSGLSYQIQRVLNNGLKWKGQNISRNLFIKKLPSNTVGFVSENRSQNVRFVPEYQTYLNIEPNPKTRVFWNDGTINNVYQRIKHEIKGKPADIIIIKADEDEMLDIVDLFGNPPVTNVSSLASPKAGKRSTTSAVAKIYEVKDIVIPISRENLREVDYDISQGGVFAHLSKFAPLTYPGGQALPNIMLTMKKLGLIPNNRLFGVPATYKTLPDKHTNFRNVWDVLTEYCTKLKDDPQFWDHAQAFLEMSVLTNISFACLIRAATNTPLYPNSLFGEFYSLVRSNASTFPENIHSQIELMRYCPVSLDRTIYDIEVSIRKEMSDFTERFTKQYPLSIHIPTYNTRFANDLVDYCNLVDSQLQNNTTSSPEPKEET